MRTLIIGGGLSGLALAEMLEARGADYLLVEARARLGGRIKTTRDHGGYFDMGPAWFWPHQPRIAALIVRLGLKPFDQYAQGDLLYEDAQGQVQRGRGFASMQGSYRLEGGLAALTDALAARVSQVRLQCQVTDLTRLGAGITARLSNGETITADRVVLAMPPRVAANIAFEPVLSADAMGAMQGVGTWMAGQAKALAIYETPFWRAAGLSGDATSRHGPMVEVHDASPARGGPYGLFGFIGVPAQGRTDEAALRAHIMAQFVRLFGAQAGSPIAVYLKDWAADPHTATLADQAPTYAHPEYGMPEALHDLWGGALQFAGTEVATQFGGYLEGALEAAEAAADRLR